MFSGNSTAPPLPHDQTAAAAAAAAARFACGTGAPAHQPRHGFLSDTAVHMVDGNGDRSIGTMCWADGLPRQRDVYFPWSCSDRDGDGNDNDKDKMDKKEEDNSDRKSALAAAAMNAKDLPTTMLETQTLHNRDLETKSAARPPENGKSESGGVNAPSLEQSPAASPHEPRSVSAAAAATRRSPHKKPCARRARRPARAAAAAADRTCAWDAGPKNNVPDECDMNGYFWGYETLLAFDLAEDPEREYHQDDKTKDCEDDYDNDRTSYVAPPKDDFEAAWKPAYPAPRYEFRVSADNKHFDVVRLPGAGTVPEPKTCL